MVAEGAPPRPGSGRALGEAVAGSLPPGRRGCGVPSVEEAPAGRRRREDSVSGEGAVPPSHPAVGGGGTLEEEPPHFFSFWVFGAPVLGKRVALGTAAKMIAYLIT